MDDFSRSFNFLMKLEGGFKLHEVPGDRGGMTYAGIARKFNPEWGGWEFLDNREKPPATLVKEFYHRKYWVQIQGDSIKWPVNCSLFCCAVNMGTRKAIILIQIAVNALYGERKLKPDGIIGDKTLSAVSTCDPKALLSAFTVAKVARYAEIVKRDRSQRKFLFGWINRALAEASCDELD